MTPEELQSFMQKHRLGMDQFSALIGLSPSAVHHWLSGKRSIAKPYGRLIRLFDRHPELMGEFR